MIYPVPNTIPAWTRHRDENQKLAIYIPVTIIDQARKFTSNKAKFKLGASNQAMTAEALTAGLLTFTSHHLRAQSVKIR